MGDVVQTKNIVNQIEENEPEKLNNLLETFYAEVKNKNGDDYEPDSLRVMIAALYRYLIEKGYKFSIIRDREFHSSKQVLEGKARQLRQSGMGKRPNKARSLTGKKKRCCGRQRNLVPKLQKRLFLLCGSF